MNAKQNSKTSFTIIELIMLASDQYKKDKGPKVVSIEESEVSNVSSTDIVILRDKESRIIGHYQHRGDGTFFNI
jgi:hypothetical protein